MDGPIRRAAIAVLKFGNRTCGMGKKHKAIAGGIITASGPWTELLLVCGKCSDKLGGGFGPKQRDELADAYKQMLRDGGRRREVRILEVGCLGVCPKGGVTVMHGARPSEMLVIPEGFDLTELDVRLSRRHLDRDGADPTAGA